MTSNYLYVTYNFADPGLISAYSGEGLDLATMKLNTLETLKCEDGRIFKDNYKKMSISIP